MGFHLFCLESHKVKKITLLFSFCVYLCLRAHSPAHSRWPEDNLQELFLSFYYVGLRVEQGVNKHHYLLLVSMRNVPHRLKYLNSFKMTANNFIMNIFIKGNISNILLKILELLVKFILMDKFDT